MSHTLFASRSRVVAALLMALGLGAGVALHTQRVVGEDPAPRPAHESQSVENARSLSRAFRKATEMVNPAVVTIHSKTKAQPVKHNLPGHKRGEEGENPLKGTPFEEFFGEHGENFNFGPGGGMPRREGMGSGVIIDKEGLILTNNHVVEGADTVTVQLSDGREFKGEDIKVDPQTDLAIVRIKGAGTLPAAHLGDSNSLEVGDWVLAIGNPFGQEHSVSAGIISGKGREIDHSHRAQYLQTDAAINPGNSGGPLIDLDGEIIGINTAIATNTGSFNGIGFAIPSNVAKWVVDQLSHSGSVQRAYLGVGISRLDSVKASKFQVRPDEGVLIEEVYPGTPAAEAGMQSGDIVKSFGGHAVHNPRELQEQVERVPLGSKHEMVVIRDGKDQPLTITAKALPDKFGVIPVDVRKEKAEPEDKANYEAADLGLAVTETTPENLAKLGYKGYSGVLVSSVEPDGAAAEQGLQPGVLITKVGKTQIASVEDFKKALSSEKLENGILMQVRSKAGSRFAVLQQ